MQRRSDGPLVDPDIVFPKLDVFDHPKKLPTTKSVIGVIRHLTDNKYSHQVAIQEVSKLVYAKWYHDTVYCLSIRSINRKLTDKWNTFREGRKRWAALRREGKALQKYSKLVGGEADKLFDVHVNDNEACKTEWGVRMSGKEREYYEDMKNNRLMECDHGVDPVWYTSMIKKQRAREMCDKYRERQREQFRTVDIDQIKDCLGEDGALLCSSQDEGGDDSEEGIEEADEASVSEPGPSGSGSKRKKRKFNKTVSENENGIPLKYCHLRDSERIVRDDVYSAIADLQGSGMSIQEASDAVVIIGKKMFDLPWKGHDESNDSFDLDTMPHKRNVLDKMHLIEAQSLSLTVREIQTRSAEGRMITHAIDSTTKRRVGTFASQGIHVGQNVPFPLPLLPICGESTEDIALQTDFAFEVLQAVTGEKKEDIYKLIDTHMTDSTEHNKGFAQLLADLYNLETAAGQLFCGTHTTLGFSTAMCKMVSAIERDMKLENILAHFMVDIEADSKHECFAAQSLDMMLKLVAPEFNNKQWNYNKAFLDFLEKNDADKVLFAYKDHRFGCLSRAAGVLLYNFGWLEQYLADNPQITNRLACLVRDVIELPYLKVIFVVFAAIGIQLIEPFYSNTIDSSATHSKLKIFYKDLYSSMDTKVNRDFFIFDKPQFAGVSVQLFEGVKKSYTTGVVDAIVENGKKHEEECIKLTNFILPELRIVLARQRRDYGISDEFAAEFPVEEQAANVDDTPVNDIHMERSLATADYRLPKLRTLNAVSRSMIFSKTSELRDKEKVSFRSFRKEAEKKREVSLKWSEKMKEKFAKGMDEKKVTGQTKERKRLEMLEEIKKFGGPFTNADQVQEFLNDASINDGDAKRRLKLELKFARDSSTSLPKSDPIFRIQVTQPNKKRRDKNREEFAESLMCYLGKREGKNVIDFELFVASLDNCIAIE